MNRSKHYCLTIPALPPTLNDIIGIARTSRHGSASLKKRWTARIEKYCEGCPTFYGKVYLEFVWKIRNFSRDADNVAAAAKYIMDGMVEAGVIKDDSLRYIESPVIHWYNRADSDGVDVHIYNAKAYSERRKQLQTEFLPPQ